MNKRPALAASASTARPAQPTARGYRIRDFCEREGISRATCWHWARKGVVRMSRLGPAVGVRVVYADPDLDDLDD